MPLAIGSTQRRIGSLFVVLAVLISFGTLVFHELEGWSYIDSFYFTGITLTTIGYGDLIPTHDISKLVTVGFALSGVAIFLYALGVIATHYFQKEQQFEAYEAQKIREIVGNISLPFKKQKKKI